MNSWEYIICIIAGIIVGIGVLLSSNWFLTIWGMK